MKTILQIKDYIKEKGCCFADGLIENYYLSLQTKPFAFVLGNSDTDMSCLPRLFAESVGATAENGRYLQLSVRPDWMDSSDLFGWLNLEGTFIPGAIMDFLKRAHDDQQNPYFLCLDKVIVSRAEYYLRDILNALDTRGQEKPLPYVPLIYYGRDEKAIAHYGEIPLLNNLYIVATVNLDETSLPLNQKLLDRVHTLRVDKEDLKGSAQKTLPAVEIPADFLQTRYYSLEQSPYDLDAYFQIFKEINTILMEATSYVGFQIRNEGILYLLHNRDSGILSEQDAMDHVICQKVLPRVQGSKKMIGPMLEKLHAYLQENGYRKSAEKTAKMLVQSETEDYISYWM